MDNETRAKILLLISSTRELAGIIFKRVEKDEGDWQALQSAEFHADQVLKRIEQTVDYKALHINNMKRGLES